MAEFINLSPNHDLLRLSGEWALAHATAIQKELQQLPQGQAQLVQARIDRLDTAGAGLLQELAEKLAIKPEQITGLTATQNDLMALVSAHAVEEAKPAEPKQNFVAHDLTELGKFSTSIWHDLLDFLRFLGQATVTLGMVLLNPARLRLKSLTRHMQEAGVSAIPIVSLIAFLISVVLAYQGATQLRRFGADIFTINLVAVSVLREMGVLLTAIMIAGRSGSAFTAEIGVMKVNEEIDAMQLIGVKPFEFLVLPRLLALVMVMPLLTFIADMMGLIGGAIISASFLNIGIEAYIDRVQHSVKMWDFWVGMIKAPFFGFFIAVVACMRGMQVTGSAESVGRLTTTSVVQSIFMVLLLDALFSILFTKLGI